MSVANDEPEVPAELPPLDRNPDELDELDDEELGELLPKLGRLGGDEEDSETDTQVELDLLPEPGEGSDDEGELGFDATELLSLRGVEADADDALGLDDFDGSTELETGEVSSGGREEEEPGGDFGTLVQEGDLPELDADEGSFDDEERWGSLGIVGDETEIAAAPEPWQFRLALGAPERCFALAVSDGVCAAASADLIWLDQASGTPVRTAIDGTRVSSLALVGRDLKVALCVTGLGRLFRRTRRDSNAERVESWRRAAELAGSVAEGLELCQLGSEAPLGVVARLSSGALLRSDDAGATWAPIESPLTSLVISPSGSPLAALSRAGERLSLSSDGGRSWEHFALGQPALSVAGGETPLLAAAGPVVAIADSERGLVVSSDGGRSFRVVGASGNVTAVAAGLCAERPAVWVALYREAVDRASIALVDVTRAEATIIGVLESPDPLEPDAGGERSRVERLWWDGTHLWAAGGFGVAVWWPPTGKLASDSDS